MTNKRKYKNSQALSVKHYNGNSKKSGIYIAICKENASFYIGSCKEFKRRWKDHERSLNDGNHFNTRFQRCWTKYGEESFVWEVLELMEDSTQEERKARETIYLEWFWHEDILNFSKNACLGINNADKSMEELYGIEKSNQIKEKISNIRKGKTYEEMYGEEDAKDLKEKLSELQTGENNPFYGKTHSPENKIAINENRRDKTYEEIYGKEKSDEIKEKKSIAASQQTLSEDHKEKIRQSRIKTYDNIQLLSPDGTLYTEIVNLSKFCRNHELSISKIHNVLSGKRNHHKNWTIIKS